jgi:putative membrane protein
MSRATFDQSTCESLSECVKEIERSTNAEVVVVVRARSANYQHADYLFGALLAFCGLLFLLFSPVDFHQYWVAIDVFLLFTLGAWLSSRSPAIRRAFTTKQYRKDAVRAGAAATFYEAGVANTNAESGLLIYLSLLERRLEVIADRGVLQAVPAREWNQRLFDLHQAGRRAEAELLLRALRKLGALLATHLPASGENLNELPDLPRFELK